MKTAFIIFMVGMTIIHLLFKFFPDNKENKRGAMPFFERFLPPKAARITFNITGALLIIFTIVYVFVILIMAWKFIGII